MEPYCIAARLHKLELVRMLAHRRALQADRLYFGQMPILRYVHEHPGCMQVEIADFLQVTPASIALSTKRLQRVGYIEKKVDADNLRCKRLYLSASGELVFNECQKKLSLLDLKMIEGLTEEEKLLFTSLLDRITINLTGEEVNTVNGETLGSLHRQLDDMNRKSKSESD